MESQAPHNRDLFGETDHVSPGAEPPEQSWSDARPVQERDTSDTIVVKIGGSTLGSHDTTLQDLVTLQQNGERPVVVHGGGKVITEWMERRGVRPRFVRGLRVTDAASLDIVVAVLTGLVNKSLVASIMALGGRAIGVSGADAGILRAEVLDPELGFVGRVVEVNLAPIRALLEKDWIPVIAPVALETPDRAGSGGSLLNVNADTAAGEIAAALKAKRLVFLTDVEGVLDSSRRLISRLTERQASGLVGSNIVAGGMVPKLEACLTALEQVDETHIVDGRKPNALADNIGGKASGTRVG